MSNSGFKELLGRSAAMLALFEQIRLLKDSDEPVLVLGEAGTGKNLIASALHYEGRRAAALFVPVNSAGLPDELVDCILFGHHRETLTGLVQDRPGLIELADGGTIYFDGIEDMPPALQSKLLRYLESGEFRRVGENTIRTARARVLSSSNCSFAPLIRAKKFRQDLFSRLATVRLLVPPLRERREDIPILVDHFLDLAQQRLARRVPGMTEGAWKLVMGHDWPGNVRQLRGAIGAASGLAPENAPIEESHLRKLLRPM